MLTRLLFAAVLGFGSLDATTGWAQTCSRGQAASPGQSRAVNRLPQPPSGGRATGLPASGPQTSQQRQAEAKAKRATEICKGC